MLKLLNQSDKTDILSYLVRNELETTFLYANIIEFGIVNKPDIRRCADYYGYFDQEELRGILPFYNLGSCIPHYERIEAVPLFADLMEKRHFQYLLGMQNIVKPLLEAIKCEKNIVEFDESSYFVNKNFVPFTQADVEWLDAPKTPDQEVIEFIIEGRLKGFNQTVTAEDVAKTLDQRSAEEDYVILKKEGKIVAQACIQTYTPTLGQIGGVYTAEDERGKGYCKTVVSELCKRIISRGKMPTLGVKKENLPAVHAYQALGFRLYEDYLIVRFA